MAKYRIHCDGSNSSPTGNGPAGSACVVLNEEDSVVDVRYGVNAQGTNNRMELEAILFAVEWVSLYTEAEDKAHIVSDSQYAVYTLAKTLGLDYIEQYNTSKHQDIHKKVSELWEGHRTTLEWIPRGQNHIADRAANDARRKALAKYT